MRKNRLRELAYRDVNNKSVLTPRTIDPVVYMLAELGETNFGAEFIDEIWDDIYLSNGEYSRKNALEIVTNEFFKHLMAAFTRVGKIRQDEYVKKFKDLPPLTDKTYVDYFVLFITVDQAVSNTPLQRACPNLQSLLMAYQTESPLPLCEGIVTFFKEMKDPEGFKSVIRKLCSVIKES